MKELNGAPDFLIKMWLGKEIYESEIREVSAVRNGEGCKVTLEGQTFGLIGAVASIVHGLSKSSERPTSELLYLIKMAVEIIEENKPKDKNCDCDKTEEEIVNSFDEYLRKYLNKEGEE